MMVVHLQMVIDLQLFYSGVIDLQKLIEFFGSVQGGIKGFRFRDWSNSDG